MAAGQTTRSDGRTLTYDAENRVTQVSTGETYSYDAGRQRTIKTEGTKTTYYFFGEYEEEYTAGTLTNTTKRYQGVAERTTTQGLVYVHSDHLGSSTVLSDASGTVVRRQWYKPFGGDAQVTGTATTKYQFTGQEKDATGLYYYNARYYDPDLGQFTQVDPIHDGENPYAYCVNDPVNLADPTGLGTYTPGVGYTSNSGGSMSTPSEYKNDTYKSGSGAKTESRNSTERVWILDSRGRPYAYVGDSTTPGSNSSSSAKTPEAKGGATATVNTSTGNLSTSSSGSGTSKSSGGDLLRTADVVASHLNDAMTAGLSTEAQAQWSSNRALAVGLFTAGVLVAVINVATFGEGTEIIFLARATVREVGGLLAKKVGTTVLGHYPEYVKLAEELDARIFQIPLAVWEKMSPAERWVANAKFLDRAVARGDTFQLATKATEARAGSFFERELQYLAGKGYTIGPGGTSLLPPVRP